MLKLEKVCTYYKTKAGVVKAVDNVSMEIKQGEILGLVGESGCGKSTLARTIMQLVLATSGQIYLEGQDLSTLSTSEIRAIRPRFQMVFQDPYASLNPRLSIFATLAEAVKAGNPHLEKTGINDQVASLLKRVGLSAEASHRYPHEFSGGQRQRIAIARAIATNPKLIIADEPVSALDVSIQAQILSLLKEIVQEMKVSLLFISHDLAVVRHLCPNVAVMYLGKIVEQGTSQSVIEQPIHPYTKALVSAVPSGVPNSDNKRILLKGEPPSPLNPPRGCTFHPRCSFAVERCSEEVPELGTTDGAEPDHCVRCFRKNESLLRQ